MWIHEAISDWNLGQKNDDGDFGSKPIWLDVWIEFGPIG